MTNSPLPCSTPAPPPPPELYSRVSEWALRGPQGGGQGLWGGGAPPGRPTPAPSRVSSPLQPPTRSSFRCWGSSGLSAESVSLCSPFSFRKFMISGAPSGPQLLLPVLALHPPVCLPAHVGSLRGLQAAHTVFPSTIPCGGSFYVSPRQGHGVLEYLLKHSRGVSVNVSG